MKVLITEICTGKPDGVTEIVYTDGREYDLPEGLARKFMDEGKAKEPSGQWSVASGQLTDHRSPATGHGIKSKEGKHEK